MRPVRTQREPDSPELIIQGHCFQTPLPLTGKGASNLLHDAEFPFMAVVEVLHVYELAETQVMLEDDTSAVTAYHAGIRILLEGNARSLLSR